MPEVMEERIVEAEEPEKVEGEPADEEQPAEQAEEELAEEEEYGTRKPKFARDNPEKLLRQAQTYWGLFRRAEEEREKEAARVRELNETLERQQIEAKQAAIELVVREYLINEYEKIEDILEKSEREWRASGQYDDRTINEAIRRERARCRKLAREAADKYRQDLLQTTVLTIAANEAMRRNVKDWVAEEIDQRLKESKKDGYTIRMTSEEVNEALKKEFGNDLSKITRRDVRLVTQALQREKERRARLGAGREHALSQKAESAYPNPPRGSSGALTLDEARELFVRKQMTPAEWNLRWADKWHQREAARRGLR